MLIFRLFWEFFKTGLFAIGGGLATLPFLYDMQAATGWFTLDDISNMIAISESTPGPMGINMATYTGFTSMGVLGGIAAVAGLVTPSIIIIIIVSNILEKFKTNKYVQHCMYGLRFLQYKSVYIWRGALCYLQENRQASDHLYSCIWCNWCYT